MNIATLYNEPRVYAYTLPGIPKLDGWIKVGYTDRQTVAERISHQLKTPLLDYRIEMDEPAYTKDGRFFRDSAIHKVLEEKGFQRARSRKSRRFPRVAVRVQRADDAQLAADEQAQAGRLVRIVSGLSRARPRNG